jgi:hypothetical protein
MVFWPFQPAGRLFIKSFLKIVIRLFLQNVMARYVYSKEPGVEKLAALKSIWGKVR